MIYFVASYCLLLGLWLSRAKIDMFSPIAVGFLFLFSIAVSIIFDKTFVDGTNIDYLIILFSLTSLLLIPLLTTIRTYRNFLALSTNEKLTSYTLNKRQLIFIYLLFFTSLTAYFYVEFFSQKVMCIACAEWSGEIKNLSLEKAHRAGKDSKLQILASQIHVFGALIFHHSLTTPNPKVRKITLFICLIPFTLAIIKTSKSDLLFAMITYGVFLYYSKIGKSKSVKKMIVIIATLLLALFVLAINQRTTSLGGDYNDLVDFKDSRISSIEAPLYGYTAGSVDNFIIFLQKNDYPVLNSNLGSSALRPLLSIFLMGDEADRMLEGEANYILGPGATVGTYMRSLVHEGGILWLFIISVFYGLIISFFYTSFIKTGSAVRLSMYALLLIPWLMLPFQNLFANLNFWAGLFLLAALGTLKRTLLGNRSW